MSRDFIFGTDGHAGFSIRKAAEFLMVAPNTVRNSINALRSFSVEDVENVERQGVRGEDIAKLCVYLSKAPGIKPEKRQHCQGLLNDAENLQARIDWMAKSSEQSQQTSLIFDSQPEPVELAPVQEIEYEAQPIDFVFGSDGHAGLSQRKAAELLKVNQSMISRLLKGDALFTNQEAEKITAQGFRGDALVKLAKHFSLTPRVNPETKSHCLGLLEKAAIVGIQTFIDRMAGIVEQPQPQQQAFPQPTVDEQLNTIEKAMSLLARLGGLDDRTELAYSDRIRNITLGNQLALSSATNTADDREWTISDRVVILGYPSQRNSVLCSIGILAAKYYRDKHGTEPITRIQYVDGAPRQVKSYRTPDLDILDRAIRAKLGQSPGLGLPPAHQ